MQDPHKKEFILESIEKIKELKEQISEYRREHKDTSELMIEVQKVVQKIQNKADEVFESSQEDVSPEELEVFLQSPSNFSKEDWDLLEAIKKETAACKQEIIKAGEGAAVKDLIGKKKKKHRMGKPKKA